jgi:hypothetical protein
LNEADCDPTVIYGLTRIGPFEGRQDQTHTDTPTTRSPCRAPSGVSATGRVCSAALDPAEADAYFVSATTGATINPHSRRSSTGRQKPAGRTLIIARLGNLYSAFLRDVNSFTMVQRFRRMRFNSAFFWQKF